MKVLNDLQHDWPMAVEIHKLASRVWRQAEDQQLKTVLLTSALRGEGKSTTASYLAVAVALNSEKKVLVMDMDFRRSQLNEYLGLEIEWGLADVLQGDCPLDAAITPSLVPNLDVIFPAKSDADPNLLINSPGLLRVFKTLREQYDLIILDGPAMIPVADSSCLLPLCDGVILVVMAGTTSRPHLAQAREICLGMGANLLGVVVGNVQEAAPDFFDPSYYHSYSRGSHG
jgi:tyrosine-protein kinase Etk/Wzc